MIISKVLINGSKQMRQMSNVSYPHDIPVNSKLGKGHNMNYTNTFDAKWIGFTCGKSSQLFCVCVHVESYQIVHSFVYQ